MHNNCFVFIYIIAGIYYALFLSAIIYTKRGANSSPICFYGVLRNKMDVFYTDNIDRYIGAGVICAAEDIGLKVDSAFKKGVREDPSRVIVQELNQGNPLAYIASMICDGLKYGRHSPLRKLSDPLIMHSIGNEFSDIFSLVERVRDAANKPELYETLDKQLIDLPSVKEMADILLLSMGLQPKMYALFVENYPPNELEFKLCVYYGQASLGRKKEQGRDGMVEALDGLADDIVPYMVIMQIISRDHFRQAIIDKKVFENRFARAKRA